MSSQVILYLVRHGQSEGNVNGDIAGSNPPLTDRGFKQANDLSRAFTRHNIDRIISSDLIRASQTASTLSKNLSIPLTQTPHLRERFFGALEGKPQSFLQANYKEEIYTFQNLPSKEQFNWKLVSDMETLNDVHTRTHSLFNELLSAYPQKELILVTHANVILAHLISLKFATYNQLPPGSIKNTGYLKINHSKKRTFIEEVFNITKTL